MLDVAVARPAVGVGQDRDSAVWTLATDGTSRWIAGLCDLRAGTDRQPGP